MNRNSHIAMREIARYQGCPAVATSSFHAFPAMADSRPGPVEPVGSGASAPVGGAVRAGSDADGAGAETLGAGRGGRTAVGGSPSASSAGAAGRGTSRQVKVAPAV